MGEGPAASETKRGPSVLKDDREVGGAGLTSQEQCTGCESDAEL